MRRRRRAEEEAPAEPRGEDVAIVHDTVNEAVILAAACVDVEVRARLVKILPPERFLDEGHRAAWHALRELEHRKLDFDLATLQQVGGDKVNTSYLGQLLASRPEAPANLDFHLGALLWDSQRAQAVVGPIASLIEAVRDPRESPERVRALARSVGQAFDGHGGHSYLVPPGELVRENMLSLDKRTEGINIYPYGVEGLDLLEDGSPRMIPGTAPGMITVLTGISGGGKSTMAAHMALGIARGRRRVLYGAWEMSANMTLELLACLSLGWARTDVVLGRNFTHERKVEFEEKQHAIGKWVRFMRNPFRRKTSKRSSNEHNLDVVREHIADSGCEVFIADLWLRCLVDKDPESEEDALWSQQAMVEELGVHGILLHQQRLKDIEMRTDPRPTREGVKGSAAWVEVPDAWIGVHRPALFKRVEDNRLEGLILKQRYGEYPIAVEFDWNAKTGHIGNGRSIEYMRPGELGGDVDKALGMKTPEQGGRRGRGRRGG
jgi:hypothetical protein